MDASFDPVSDAPTPTPRTPLRDIKSVSRVLMAFTARWTDSLVGSPGCAPSETGWSGTESAQTLPTKLTGPTRALSLVRTSWIGLPIVDELLPAKSKATG